MFDTRKIILKIAHCHYGVTWMMCARNRLRIRMRCQKHFIQLLDRVEIRWYSQHSEWSIKSNTTQTVRWNKIYCRYNTTLRWRIWIFFFFSDLKQWGVLKWKKFWFFLKTIEIIQLFILLAHYIIESIWNLRWIPSFQF